jgi:fibronectin type 3 domain-containing protein
VKKLSIILMALLVLFAPVGLLAQQTATITLSLVVTHAATLTWNASATVGVTQYNVYRGTVSGGPYTMIASGNFLTYTDTNVTSGSTYYWVVTAVENGTQSSNSNEVSGMIP